MSESLAAVFNGVSNQIELRKIPRPRPLADEMVIRVLGCTLCGSDLHTFEGRRQAAVPTILGHEIVGQIEEFGDRSAPRDMSGQELRIGDRVTWTLVASCGECFFCTHGLPQKCLRAVKYGHEPLRPSRELLGGLAEHCVLVPGTSIVRLPDELPLAVACPANCATATAAAAIEAAGNLKGGSVCVLGAGLLGLTVCAMTSALGAANVICVELHPERRARAKSFGATHAVSPDELADTISQLTAGRGVDAAIELTGSPAAFTSAWPLLRTGGTFVVVGAVFPSSPVDLHLEQLVRRHLVLRGIHNYSPPHLLSAVQFLTENHLRFPFADLVTQWEPLPNVERAFSAARDPNNVRVGIRPASASEYPA